MKMNVNGNQRRMGYRGSIAPSVIFALWFLHAVQSWRITTGISLGLGRLYRKQRERSRVKRVG